MFATAPENYWTLLLETGPFIMSLVIAVIFLWRDNKSLSKYVRTMERENLTTLQDLSNLINNLIQTTDRTKIDLSQKVVDEGHKIKDVIIHRTAILEEKINKSPRE